MKLPTVLDRYWTEDVGERTATAATTTTNMLLVPLKTITRDKLGTTTKK